MSEYPFRQGRERGEEKGNNQVTIVAWQIYFNQREFYNVYIIFLSLFKG